MIVTAALTTGIAATAQGMTESRAMIEKLLKTEHTTWESLMWIGEVEFRKTREGPIPNHQLRLSVKPESGFAAINYQDNDDLHMPNANSHNPTPPTFNPNLVFNGRTASVFPLSAALPIGDVREALFEWLTTRRRPTCIQWEPFDNF